MLCLALLLMASCSTVPSEGRSRTIFGRIVSTPEVEIWLGHVTGGGQVYEVAPEHGRRRLIGLMVPPQPVSRCPYNGRPREQLFMIEYAVDSATVYGPADPGASLSPHLMTSLVVVRCDWVGGSR